MLSKCIQMLSIVVDTSTALGKSRINMDRGTIESTLCSIASHAESRFTRIGTDESPLYALLVRHLAFHLALTFLTSFVELSLSLS